MSQKNLQIIPIPGPNAALSALAGIGITHSSIYIPWFFAKKISSSKKPIGKMAGVRWIDYCLRVKI